MIKTPLPLLLALMLASPVIAQETTEDAPAAETNPDDGLSLGTPLEGAEAPTVDDLPVGQPYLRGESGDWSYRCLRAPEGQIDPCQLYQLLRDQDDNEVAEVSMFPPAKRWASGCGCHDCRPA